MRLGTARPGGARLGWAWPGRAWRGRAGQGEARLGEAMRGDARRGQAGQCLAGQGAARRGRARRGLARQGKARRGKEAGASKRGSRYLHLIAEKSCKTSHVCYTHAMEDKEMAQQQRIEDSLNEDLNDAYEFQGDHLTDCRRNASCEICNNVASAITEIKADLANLAGASQ